VDLGGGGWIGDLLWDVDGLGTSYGMWMDWGPPMGSGQPQIVLPKPAPSGYQPEQKVGWSTRV
jgi:hypothetical protein